MGCLKLSYYQTYSNRKVLYSECVLEPKTAQIWLSVDPMSDKYPSLSPYNYCANNPVILVDPDGKKDKPFNAKYDKPVTRQPGTSTPVEIVKNDKGEEIFSIGSNNAYNCHSYAWHKSQGDSNPGKGDIPSKNGTTLPFWDNNPADDIKEQNAIQLGMDENNIPGDLLIFYTDADGNGQYDEGEFISHSAVVKTVDNDGNTTTVVSKMGAGEISENHPRAPKFYQKVRDYFTGKNENQSRAYFRVTEPIEAQ